MEKEYLFQELSSHELKEISGGMVITAACALVGLLLTCIGGAYAFGKDCAIRDNARSKK